MNEGWMKLCHYNCWMKVEWNFVTIIVEWRLNEELRMKLCVCIIKCLSKNVTHLLSWMFMIKNHDALLKCLCWRCDEELLNEVWNECWNNCCDEVCDVLKLCWSCIEECITNLSLNLLWWRVCWNKSCDEACENVLTYDS